LVLPAVVAALVANDLLIPHVANFWSNLFGAPFHLQGGNGPVWPFTVTALFASFVWAVWCLRELEWPRRVLVALAFPWAFALTYEWAWDLSSYAVRPLTHEWVFSWVWILIAGTALVGGWSTCLYWRWTARVGVATLAVVILFAGWLAIGFPQWTLPSELGWVLNVVTKMGTALIFALGLAEGTNWGRPMRATVGKETGIPVPGADRSAPRAS
jgi:hypothetical protein